MSRVILQQVPCGRAKRQHARQLHRKPGLSLRRGRLDDAIKPHCTALLTSRSTWPISTNTGGGRRFLKTALGFCCQRTDAGLELIIRGNQPVASAISTVAHEASHARQKIANSIQDKGDFGSDLDALQETEAYAFEVALTRKLGEYAGINTSVFPDLPGIQAFVDEFRESLRESLDSTLQYHNRGLLFIWLAALHDPELAHLKVALTNGKTLSPEAMLELHDRLVRLTPAEATVYVETITQTVSDDLNFILGSIDRRIGYQVDFTGLIENVPELTLMP